MGKHRDLDHHPADFIFTTETAHLLKTGDNQGKHLLTTVPRHVNQMPPLIVYP